MHSFQTDDERALDRLLGKLGFLETATKPFFTKTYAPHIIAPLTSYILDQHVQGVGMDAKKRSHLFEQICKQLCNPADPIIGMTARAFSPPVNPQIKIYVVAFGHDLSDRLIFIHDDKSERPFAPALLSDFVRVAAAAPPTTAHKMLDAIGRCPPVSLEHVSAQLVHGAISAPAPL
jgi:hypothetical protein